VLALEQRDRTQMTLESLRFRLTSSARALDYWRKVDKDLGERIAAGIKEE
jgi:hypothetical protein